LHPPSGLKQTSPRTSPKDFIMVQMTGKYKRTSAEKYEDFLSKLGMGFIMKKAATASTPTMEITESGGKWKMVTSTTMKTISLEFELVISS
jgi:hypothetical protein